MARDERGIEGMPRAQSNPHQDEIDAVGTFFEVEQQLAAPAGRPARRERLLMSHHMRRRRRHLATCSRPRGRCPEAPCVPTSGC